MVFTWLLHGTADYGCYAEYLLEWQHHIRDHPERPVHIMYYENMKQVGMCVYCFAVSYIFL